MSATHKNGVLFVATGDYALAAHHAAASIREHSPNLGIQIFTDCKDLPAEHFDHIGTIPDPHRRSKVDFISQSCFERTLYLDSDIRIVEDISEMFMLLDRFDIAVAHAHMRNHSPTTQLWRCEIPESFPQMNAGVILFNNSPGVMKLLADWRVAYKEAGFAKDQVSLRELLWLSDLRIATLPPEYNIRYEKYLEVWAEKEARPRILHYARFHQDMGLALHSSTNRWKRRLKRACSLFTTKGN